MSGTGLLDRTYSTTFTALKKAEPNKTCPECKKYLAAGKFKCKRIKRNGVDGIARNEKCRACENSKIAERKGERTSIAEIAIDALTHNNEKMKKEFLDAVRMLRSDLDRCLSENKKLRREIEDYRDEMVILKNQISDSPFYGGSTRSTITEAVKQCQK